MSNMKHRALIAAVGASLVVLLTACGSEPVEQAQVVSEVPTSVPTTPPLAAPTLTPLPTPTSTALPEITTTPLPAPTVAPTLEPAPSPTIASDTAPLSTEAPASTDDANILETPTPLPTPTVEEPEVTDGDSASTPAAQTPTAVVTSSGEPPLECYDAGVDVYRAFVDGVDALTFEGGRVYCTGAGTNAVSAAGSYRHSSGLVVRRNADYIFNDAGTAYIPYSGSVYFCVNGQPASAPIAANTVPTLLVVIDNEAQRQLAQGATGPAAFTDSGSQC